MTCLQNSTNWVGFLPYCIAFPNHGTHHGTIAGLLGLLKAVDPQRFHRCISERRPIERITKTASPSRNLSIVYEVHVNLSGGTSINTACRRNGRRKQYIWCVEYESNRTGRAGVARYGGGEDGDNGHGRGNGNGDREPLGMMICRRHRSSGGIRML